MISIFIGMVSGVITGMGMGGGTILILLLTIFSGIDQRAAQAINLIFFVPTSITTIIVGIKNKTIDLKLAIKLSIFGIIGAIIGAIISSRMEVNTLKKFFAVFLVFIAFNEIYGIYKENNLNKKRNNNIDEK